METEMVIPVSSLFEMISGASTASFLAGAMSIPSNVTGQEDRPFLMAKDGKDFYIWHAKNIFKSNMWGGTYVFLMYMFVPAAVGFIFYSIGTYVFDNPH